MQQYIDFDSRSSDIAACALSIPIYASSGLAATTA